MSGFSDMGYHESQSASLIRSESGEGDSVSQGQLPLVAENIRLSADNSK
jgi:hypothetical protein